MNFYKNNKFLFFTLTFLVALTLLGYTQDKKGTKPSSNSAVTNFFPLGSLSDYENGAANYYDLKPSQYFVALGIKGYQQTTNYTCGQAVVMSLMRWHNMLSNADLTHEMEVKMNEQMHMGDQKLAGTMPNQIVAWLEKNGFDVTAGENGTVEMLRENLKNGILTLVVWSDRGGHWVLVEGYYAGSETPEKGYDTIFFADSSAWVVNMNNPNGITSFNANEFSSRWYDDDHQNRFYGRYITAVPHKK